MKSENQAVTDHGYDKDDEINVIVSLFFYIIT